MAFQPKPAGGSLSPSSAGTSPASPNSAETQLSDSDGVETGVSTAALDRGMLMAATTPQEGAGLSTRRIGGEAVSDAEIMLRVKAGDQSAFDYLVQKYRRPMISFLYRMAHNAA